LIQSIANVAAGAEDVGNINSSAERIDHLAKACCVEEVTFGAALTLIIVSL
jgi:hypothetical protein